MLETYPDTLKIVYKTFPLPSHKMSMPAVVAAFAANRQGRFWDFHDKIYSDFRNPASDFRNLNPDKITQIAVDLKLDMARYKKDLTDNDVAAQIQRDLREVQQAGVAGTPAMFINGLPLVNRSPQGLQEIIERELRKSGKAE